MDCKEVSSRASLWLDGKLAAGESDFLRHLDVCRACAREVGELQTILTVLRDGRGRNTVSAPEGFAMRVMDRLQAERVPRFGRLPLRSLALAASFLFLLGMNSILVGRYLGEGSQVTLPSGPAAGSDQIMEIPPASLPDADEQPQISKPEVFIVPVKPAPRAEAKPQSKPLVEQPADVKHPTPERQRQVMVASLAAVTIPGPEVFVQQRRVTEGVLLKVAVTRLDEASRRLVEVAGRQGLDPVAVSEMLAADGRLIKVYRYEVPYLLSSRFVTEALNLNLGRVLDERHVTEDVSSEYGQKLEQYRQLAAKALDARGAEAEELYGAMNGLIRQLAGMHSTSRDKKAVTFWLES
ncbi:MAG: hypothetical protein KGZ57_07730 [Dethiobacter sp.]|nr:hypothetical protein [Dethiobacter sp.]MCL5982878.1 hypothetical protein [Bacillota bacterium]